MWIIEISFWASVGLWDLYLKARGHKTISQQVEKYMPQWVDVIVVVVILAVMAKFWGIAAFVVALRWVVIGHILLGHETYKKGE